MPYQEGRERSAPRLPNAGWLPDPSRTDLERYWDGRSWTSRTRDRVSKLERVPAPAYAPAPSQPQRRGKTRPWAKWALAIILVGGAAFVYQNDNGSLPDEVPYADALTRQQPVPVQVDYPVFGSDDLVVYLASAMVKQQPTIDVSYWTDVKGMDLDDLRDALDEATRQNPYVFISASSVDYRGTVTPYYKYDDETAEGKRFLTATAVAKAIKDEEVAGASTDADRVAAIHDYIANTATYDYASYEASNAGERPETSPLMAQSQEAYGILVAHTAVCNGYAQAFQLVAQAAGLDSVIVTGTASGATSGGHAWNEVLVDGEWLVVDVTWDDDDINGVVHDKYLMIPTSDPALASRSMDKDWVVDANLGEYGI